MTSRKQTQRITANTAADAKAWAKELNCTVSELRIAIRAVGDSTERVKRYLAALNGRALDAPASAERARPEPSVDGEPKVKLPPWPRMQSSRF